MRLTGIIAAAAMAATPALAQTPAVAAAPMHTAGANPTYPRLTQFPDAKVMARVNAALAAQEKMDRDSRNDCYAQIREQKAKATKDSYSESVDVTYLSRHFLSVNVVASYDCAGPYPTNGAEAPVTFSLDDGAQIDFTKLFKAGFLPADGADEKSPPSALTKLYRARYRRGAGRNDECVQAMKDQDPMGMGVIFWLDAKRGLVVQPDFPHVIAACADEMVLSAADLAPWLKDPALLADLRATVKVPPLVR